MIELEIIGQIIGMLSVIVLFVAYQMKDRKTIFFVQSIGLALMATQYFMIGAMTGAVLDCVCLIRTMFFCLAEGKIQSSLLRKYLFPALFSILVCVFAIFSWEDWYSIFLLLGLAINSFCTGACNPQNLRKSMLLTCVLVFIYNIYVLSIGGMINELLSILSAIIGIIRYRKANFDKTENTNVTDKN